MYEWTGMEKISYAEALEKAAQGECVYLLHDDDTEGEARTMEEMASHHEEGGEFGIELPKKENVELWNQIETILSKAIHEVAALGQVEEVDLDIIKATTEFVTKKLEDEHEALFPYVDTDY